TRVISDSSFHLSERFTPLRGGQPTVMPPPGSVLCCFPVEAAKVCFPASPADTDLLSSYVASRSSEAFALLLVRHAPWVQGRGRRWLGCHQDTEDATQARPG